MAAIAGSGGNVFWNPGIKNSGPNQLGSSARPSFIGLTHELGHASMAEQGRQDFSFFAPGHADPNLSRVTNDEFNAAHIENEIRSEYRMLLREFYTCDASGAGFMRFLAPDASIRRRPGRVSVYNKQTNNFEDQVSYRCEKTSLGQRGKVFYLSDGSFITMLLL